jgi:hypothetical protein
MVTPRDAETGKLAKPVTFLTARDGSPAHRGAPGGRPPGQAANEREAGEASEHDWCSPDRIRTGVTALRGRRPRPLDDGAEHPGGRLTPPPLPGGALADRSGNFAGHVRPQRCTPYRLPVSAANRRRFAPRSRLTAARRGLRGCGRGAPPPRPGRRCQRPRCRPGGRWCPQARSERRRPSPRPRLSPHRWPGRSRGVAGAR